MIIDPPYRIYNSDNVSSVCGGADIAVVCLGTGSVLEREGHDREDIDLPGLQLQLLQDAAKASSTL